MRFRPVLYLFVSSVVALTSCKEKMQLGPQNVAVKPSSDFTRAGIWKFTFNLERGVHMPVMAIADKQGHFTIKNASEEIVLVETRRVNDSLYFKAPVFDNVFKSVIISDALIKGEWINLSKKNYRIPFTAEFVTENVNESEPVSNRVIMKREVVFSKGTNDMYRAIGIFKPSEKSIVSGPFKQQWEGTFMTETGDYRYLCGYRNNDSLFLSGFDGSHVFYFTAAFAYKDDSLHGMFYSGIHWKEPWIAGVNAQVELTNPDSLTHIVHRDSVFHFSFPDLSGNIISYPSADYSNKVTVIQIMGSWCPNCLDETRYMNNLYKKYQSKGLEVIALCFERTNDYSTSVKQVSSLKNSCGVEYPFLIAGEASKNEAIKKLPILDHIMSFPTTIYLDKKGNVRKIFTGYYGPSTGSYYDRYAESTERFIQLLLAE